MRELERNLRHSTDGKVIAETTAAIERNESSRLREELAAARDERVKALETLVESLGRRTFGVSLLGGQATVADADVPVQQSFSIPRAKSPSQIQLEKFNADLKKHLESL